MKHTFKNTIIWITSHRVQSLAIAGALLIGVASVTAWALLSQPAPKLDTKPIAIKPRPPKPKYYSPLDGTEIASQADVSKPVTAIMMENSPDARPQSGLKDAQVVYEAIAEGGITRFLAVYQQAKPQLIGPVRSVRMYYLEWARPYDASIAHIGGSAAALREVRGGAYRDIDQFFNAGSYWRASDRYAPHNVYTSFEKLDALNAQKGFATSAPKGFTRSDAAPAKDTPAAATINVTISGPTYNSSYTYDTASKTYQRSQAGAPHVDREGGQIAPKVVVVMQAPMSHVQEDGVRESIQTTGSGKATIFQNGVVYSGTWLRANTTDQYSFTADTGAPIPLARGQTWVTIIPDGVGSVTWQ